MKTAAQAIIEIRSYRFQYGILHLERAAAKGMTNEEIAEQYAEQGPLLEVLDGEMSEAAFFALSDLRDL